MYATIGKISTAIDGGYKVVLYIPETEKENVKVLFDYLQENVIVQVFPEKKEGEASG